jgi:formate hydrogenlyase subunit 3/multisubunit Na+/H+ antiporter MnhD subunit
MLWVMIMRQDNQFTSLRGTLTKVGASVSLALRNATASLSQALLRLLKNLLPDADVLRLPPSAMVFIALAIPVMLAVIGGFTAIFAASMGLVMNDIKRVLAYSTISQLGYMMLGLGTGGVAIGIFHLFNHAFFKALLFMGSGSVIHAMHHYLHKTTFIKRR